MALYCVTVTGVTVSDFSCSLKSVFSQETPRPGEVEAGSAKVWLAGRVVEVPVERGPEVLRSRFGAHPDGAEACRF